MISRAVDDRGAITLTYDVLWATGGKTLEFEVVPPGQASTGDTGFTTPQPEAAAEDWEPA